VWISLFAGVGVGSVIAAVLGRWNTISNHRQAWINALRDDLVSYLKEIDVLHYRVARVSGVFGESSVDDLGTLSEARAAALLIYRRVLLRLNMTEVLHVDLADKLEALLRVEGTTADGDLIKEVIILSRQVLKQEWAVTKYGMFTKPVMATKRLLSRR
jgi:L-cystine uptake protein TcyP (sodium:dicarboxylate symporter family)